MFLYKKQEFDVFSKKGSMKMCFRENVLLWCFVSFLNLLILSTISYARDVSFSWTANSDDPPIESYRPYYKIGDEGSSLSDYDGTDALGGNASPIVIPGQATTAYTLQNLLDSEQYTFVLTAFREVESLPTPALTLPAISAPAETRQVSFGWTANNDDPPVDGYKLYYKTGNAGVTLADYIGNTDASGQNASPIVILGQNTSTYTLPDILKNERYTFVLTSYMGNVESAPTPPITLEPNSVNTPSAPQIISIEEVR